MSFFKRRISISELVRSRVLSLGFAVVFVAMRYFSTRDIKDVVHCSIALSFPVFLIWYCDAMGRMTGISTGLGQPLITRSTPGGFVAVGAWLLMFAVACMTYWVHASTAR
ncbi:MAG: hypothetical protein AAGI63_09650 [Planctomycetota bacterium]